MASSRRFGIQVNEAIKPAIAALFSDQENFDIGIINESEYIISAANEQS